MRLRSLHLKIKPGQEQEKEKKEEAPSESSKKRKTEDQEEEKAAPIEPNKRKVDLVDDPMDVEETAICRTMGRIWCE